LTVAVVGIIGCSPGPAGYRAPDGTPIVVISIDTLRSDHLPAYGYDGVDTPTIDALCRDGILFERAYTHVPLTLPAHTSLLTGLLPPAHGVRDNLGYTVDSSRGSLLQQMLQDAGYATGAAVSAFVLRGATGLDRGFDFYDDAMDLRPDTGGPGVQAAQRPGGETLAAARPWLRSVADQPFFFFFHIFEPHTPYDPPPEFSVRYESAYDGEIAAADAVVGDLLDELRLLDVYDAALIVLLSDHGEGLGEHGETEHGVFLYRSTLQVPLIVKLPKSVRAGETVGRPVQLIDIVPTVVSALDLPLEQVLPGVSLLVDELVADEGRAIFAETLYPRLHFGWSDLAAVIRGSHHLIDAPEPELYDVVSDPGETINIIGSHAELAADLEQALSVYDRRLAAPAATDPETRRQLRALGYVGEASVTDSDELPDPKEMIDVLGEIRRAHRLYTGGEFEAAVEAFRAIVDDNPGLEDAWEYLALAHLGLSRPGDAVATYRSALEHVPHSQRLSLRAAMLLLRLGRLEEASVRARFAIPYDPAAAHALLAQVALQRGDLDTAEREAREALSVSGDRRPQSRLVLADVWIARGEPVRAAGLLERTIDEGIHDDAVHSKLAMTYLRIGEVDKADRLLGSLEDNDDLGLLVARGRTAMALGRWRNARMWLERAHLLRPADPVVELNLGIVAMNEGRLGEAEELLDRAVGGNPSSIDGWNALGTVRAQRGNPEGAIDAWRNSLAIDPDYLAVVFNLGVAHAQAGQWPQAVAHLEDYAARAEPGPRRDRALAMIEQIRSTQPR
jgi:arylsulfatase A-like enzyme/tetratricopeptide (TPR) repeat protein